jgi:HPt (histidine-containing phosphotransfer) domain-containing protein
MMAVADHPSAHALVSTRVLCDLSEQMGSETCRQFVANYVEMWDGRFARLESAVTSADLSDAMDVVLSIKISSQMAGAERLAGLASIAQEMILRADHCGLASMLEPLKQCGEETLRCLSRTFPVR